MISPPHPPARVSARVLPGPLLPMGSHAVPIGRDELARRCHTLLFTRYFLRGFAPRNQTEPGRAQIKAWFTAREPLFRTYTLPSVLGQRHAGFTWYILVDEPFADWVPAEIRPAAVDPRIQLVSSGENGQPIASLADLDSFVSKQLSLRFECMRADGVSEPVVTVARLDNDDAIAVDFLELLNRLGVIAQREGQTSDTVVSFPHGLQYLRDREFSTYIFNNNHFLASLHAEPEPAGQRVHALSFNHSYVFAKAPRAVIANTDLPMWIEVVHGANLINRYRPVAPRRGNQGLEERFGSTYLVEEDPVVTIQTPSAVGDAADSAIDAAVAARSRLGTAIRDSIATSGAMKPPVFATVYESVLSRVKVERLFEIGIHQGGSIRLWRQLLGARASIACMDIKPEACDNARGVADHVYTGSQTDADLLARIAVEAGPFDIIIDDGSHQNPHMVFSFEAMFEHVRPGGAYVIEDMFTSYWPRYRGGLRKRGSLIEHAKDLVDRLYAPFVSEKYKAHFLKEVIPKLEHGKVSADVASIEFFAAGIIVVHKRATASMPPPDETAP